MENYADLIVAPHNNSLYIKQGETIIAFWIYENLEVDKIDYKSPLKWNSILGLGVNTISQSFLLEHNSIRLLFDSVLITLEVFHDTRTGRGGIEVRRVDRFDYELTDVLNWSSFENKGEHVDVVKPIVQMIGTSKIDQTPFYDWDYVEKKFRFGINDINVSHTSIVHYLILFNEFESESKSNDQLSNKI